MSDFNLIKFELAVSNSDVIETFSKLYCALAVNLDGLPESNELEVTGTLAYAPSIGTAGESEFTIKYAGKKIGYSSFCESRDNGYAGSISSNWFEAKTDDFILSISLCDKPHLTVYISSFERYDLLLDLVRNFGARVLSKVYTEAASNFKLTPDQVKPIENKTEVIEVEPVENKTQSTSTPKNQEEAKTDLSQSKLNTLVTSNTLFQSLTIQEILGFEFYVLIEERISDFFSAFSFKPSTIRKEQIKHDENGAYEKIIKTSDLELNLKLLLDRNPALKSAKLQMKFNLLTNHSYLPSQFELKVYHTNPSGYNLNTIDILLPESLRSKGIGEIIEKDLNTFLMLAKM